MTDSTLLDRFLATDSDRTLLVQRVVLGAVMLPHGAQKLLGWFGGHGFAGTMGYFTASLHIPAPFAFLVVVAESLGAVGLLLGAGTRLTALGMVAVMIGAASTHLDAGFFMNWFGAQQGEGFEYHLLALALAVPLLVRGGGQLSVDRALHARLRAGGPTLAHARGV